MSTTTLPCCQKLVPTDFRYGAPSLGLATIINTDEQTSVGRPMDIMPQLPTYTPLICNSFHLQFISFAIHLARLPKLIKIFKRPKNREDSSDFDDFRTKRMVSVPPISGKKIRKNEINEKFSKNSENCRNFRKKI